MSAERIELPPGDIDAGLVARAVNSLQQSQLIVLPTETVYGLALRPGDEAAHKAMQTLKGRPETQALTQHIASLESLRELTPSISWRLQNLVERYWPGPLTVIVKAMEGGAVGVRLPAHGFTQAVIHSLGENLLMTSVNLSGEPALADPAAIEAKFADQIALIFDAGIPPLGISSTIVRCTEDAYEVVREGTLSSSEIFQTASRLILFVCTGNTCRSPLAEALARQAVAKHLDCEPAGVFPRGLEFASAGVSTGGGSPISEGSLVVGKELGLDLQPHCSSQLTMDLANRAEKIYCLSDSHRSAIVGRAPQLEAKISLLHPKGDVFDPYGGDLPAYRTAAQSITEGIDHRLPEILAALR